MKLANITYIKLDEIDSTNEEAKRLINDKEIKNLTCIISNSQTHGKGTKGRKWVSPKNAGIYMSIIYLPENKETFEITSEYTLASGVACVEALNEIYRIKVKLKPVNDIYFEGKKLGGILVESKLSSKGLLYIVCGIGINFYKSEYKADEMKVQPISLEEIIEPESFMKILKENIVDEIVIKNSLYYKELFAGNKSLILSKWNNYALN